MIVVDDGSQDETATVCRRYASKFPNMARIDLRENGGLAKAQNAGIAAASAGFILFTDDDCIPQMDWIEKTCAALRTHPIVAGAVSTPVLPYLQLCHNVAEFHDFMPGRRKGPIPFIAGANMAFHRSVLLSLNGFDETLRIAADMDLVLRARRQRLPVYFEPDSLVTHHHDRKYLFHVFAYSARHAAATIALRNRYRRLMRTPLVLRSPVPLLLGSPVIALVSSLGIFLRNPQLAKLFYTSPVVYGLKLAWCRGAARGLKALSASEKDDD
jgi:GT2 family glycosyltransferase